MIMDRKTAENIKIQLKSMEVPNWDLHCSIMPSGNNNNIYSVLITARKKNAKQLPLTTVIKYNKNYMSIHSESEDDILSKLEEFKTLQ